jgi:hypothetical protein
MMLKHRSNVQGNEENSNRKPVFNKSVSIKHLSESINIATVKRLLLSLKQTRKPVPEMRDSLWLARIFFFGASKILVTGPNGGP